METLSRPSTALRLLLAARTRPVLSIASAAELLNMTFPTASAAISQLEKLGIMEEVTGRERDRVFAYKAYLDILNEGTETPA